MANETNEPRALSAALAAPAFTTRGAGVAMHVANRHVERWAPEASANRVRTLRSLGFVDRLVAPWIETAQRSAGLRMFSQYASQGTPEREGAAVSWVFPRPWYQDELDWMAASRQVGATVGSAPEAAPAMFTTRGTYVVPTRTQASPSALPPALYEYIAPSLSVARPAAPAGVGHGGGSDAYSPLVSLAAVQAAELMSRAVAPFVTSPTGAPAATGRMTPALRSVLTTMLERASVNRASPIEIAPTRLAMQAPEMVTPPAPRPAASQELDGSATQLAESYATQRTQVAELQRVAQRAAERELAARPAEQAAAHAQVAAQQVAAQQAAQLASTAATRETAQRTEVELRQRAAEARQAANATSATTAAAERARLEERIAQRVAERAGAQRLHDQVRSEAASHARATELAPAAAAPSVMSPAIASDPTPRRAPAEVAAAMAALPPELAQFLGQRPERAMQAIGELNEALRTVELMARTAASGAAFETTRGPRLMMPAGLGGLVAAVDRAQSISERPAMLAGQRPSFVPAPLALGAEPRVAAPAIATQPSRVPTMAWITGDRARTPSSAAPTTAFAAATQTAPTALTHVAWADRWLARFAGANPQSLGVLTAASSTSQRMEALAAAAPGSVFVAPSFDVDRVPGMRFDADGRQVAAPMAARNAPGALPMVAAAQASAAASTPASPAAIERFDDAAETPDDVFAQISAAATRNRVTTPTTTFTQPAAAASPSAPLAPTATWAHADAIAHAAPIAPGAGLSAQLASSPFASALRHLLPLPSAASFDVRSLFGSALSATYLAGLLGPASHELEIASAGPAWALAAGGAAEGALPAATRAALEWDPAYVAPEREAAARDEGTLAGETGSPTTSEAASQAYAAAAAPLTTLRTALLSWNVDAAMPTFADAPTVVGAAQSSPITTSTARAMIEAMSMPMLGDVGSAEPTTGWTAPGMVGERAHGWAVAQERSSSDLALDFVSPELVLAARVYGLGPAEAAQAARLAIAGPGQLGAMASTVDRTFVQAMAIEADRRHAEARSDGRTDGRTAASITTAYPTASGEIAAALGPAPARASETYAPYVPATVSSAPGASFGVDRRTPRGAFLWPSATVAALGMNAASPDSQQSMSVAALELLAAQAVAELGTYAALTEHADVGEPGEGATSAFGGSSRTGALPVVGGASASASASASTATSAPASRDLREPGEPDVLEAAAALVPASRRARFDALYVALSQSSNGRTWSPAARAARALALAGRGEDAPLSARDRAASAWDVLPVVYATDGTAAALSDEGTGGGASGAASTGGAAARRRTGAAARTPGRPGDFVAGDDHVISVDGRPGLGALSARAGEALGSYVTPTVMAPAHAHPSQPAMHREAMSPAMRAPTAAQELVRTGRPSGRFGGGEVEIPTWFEAAARKMFDERSGGDSGISMAELTLVTAAPSSHVAASTRQASAPLSPATGTPAGPSANAPQIDIEKVANEVYRQILVLMDASRARNGEPYL